MLDGQVVRGRRQAAMMVAGMSILMMMMMMIMMYGNTLQALRAKKTRGLPLDHQGRSSRPRKRAERGSEGPV